jgi:hypothetical protein
MSWNHADHLRRSTHGGEPASERLEAHEQAVWIALQAPYRGVPKTPVLLGLLAVAAVLCLMALPNSTPRAVVLEHAQAESVVAGLTAWSDGHVVGSVEGGKVALTVTEGFLALNVDPERSLQVTVETDDAWVFVQGTRFTVTRGPSGTLVEVGRGRVEVRCRALGSRHIVTGGGRISCLRSAGLGLGLALGQREVGAAELALTTTGEAVALSDHAGATWAALVGLQVELLLDLNRVGQALEAAALTLGGPVELHRDSWTRAARAGLGRGGCSKVQGFLEALHGSGDAQASANLARCLSTESPQQARRVLDEALLMAPTKADGQRLRDERDRLGGR